MELTNNSSSNEEISVVSVVDPQQGHRHPHKKESTPMQSMDSSYSQQPQDFAPLDANGDKDDKKYHRQQNQRFGHYNNNKRYNYSNQNYGNNNNGYGYNQRRHNNNNNTNGYNNNNYSNFRNYGNNRRQFQQQRPEFHHHQANHNQNYQNHHNNGYYNNNRGGGARPRGFPIHSLENYNGYHHHRRGNGLPIPSPEYEENLPWPAKRGNWSHGPNENYLYGNGNIQRGFYSPNSSRHCSPETSPTGDNIGTYDYFGDTSMTSQQSGAVPPINYPYSNYSAHNYYNYSHMDDSNVDAGPLRPPVAPLGLVLTTDSTVSRPVSCTDSPPSEKAMEWTTDSTDGSSSDSESVPTSVSTRCQSPEDFDDLPSLTSDSNYRTTYSNITVFAKEGFSPSTAFCVRVPKRAGLSEFTTLPREWFEDLEPDEIIKQFNQAGELSDTPPLGVPGPITSELDQSIWTKFVENQQTTETFRKKVELWRDIYRIVRYMNFTPEFKHDPRNFPAFGLQVVGSTMSGFGSNTSDVDICLVIRDSEVDQRYEAVERLQTLSQTLHLLPFVDNVELIYAKVPILKFRDANRRLDVDLNCNNFVGIRNTHLLYAYSQMDWRLKPLVLLVKLWAQFHRINDAKNMTVSSYSLVLMMIHFLQCGIEEPVLPVLHKMYPDKFNNHVPILDVKIHETMPPWHSTNNMGLGELFILFLEYYSRKFDYTRHAISVRSGSTIPIKVAANYKSPKSDFHSWKLLCVEEPFDRTNTARSVYDRDIFEKIIGIFFASWQRLLVSQKLDSIFTVISDEELRAISSAVSNRLRF